ncbi:mechanosensitive ion channel family protein [Sphingobacterium paludis]|uniref:Small-conductance mechanosensitive channel n=1 Tax=Sphingobacterium paludis TaxID=1476465 RepID=A0A4R7CUI3_9SPHI|nr:mechanosensitive ion channel domain-containing protein [Sphingobacterium paludis]TDS07479.1 small-conductance mechanosensitive channel [Sphingobacterium paludis]
MPRFALLFIILTSIFNAMAYGQTTQDTVSTVASQQIDTKQIELEAMRKQQREDSLHRLRLEDRLLQVQRNDFDEKKKLVEEINLLKSRDSLIVSRRKLKVDSLRNLNEGVGVVPFRDTLFRIYNAVGSYTAADRAAAITDRIKALAENIKFDTDSLTLQKNEENWLLLWQDQIILSINQQDALWANMDAEDLLQAQQASVKKAIDEHREETSVKRMLEAIALASLILFSLIVIIYSIGKLIVYLRKKTLRGKGRLFHGIKIRGYVLVSASKQIKFIWSLLAILRWVLVLSAIYLALPLLLNLFPQTEGYAPILLGYFLAPLRNVALAVFAYVPNLITIFVICVVFHYLLKLLKFFARELQNENLTIPGFYKEWALPTYQILRVLLLAFLLVVIFPYLPGSESPIFKGISVFIGVLFTFSSAGALGNIVAGLLLTYMRSFALGDRIKIGDVSGDIIEKSLLVTRIRTIKNEVVSIPNAQILSNHTINYSAEAQDRGLIVHVVITLAYEVPWQQVHALAKEAALKNSRLEKTPEPFVLQTGLDDFYVSYQLNAYTKFPNQQALIYSDLYKDILDVFHAAGIEILSPHYHAVRDGSSRDMPEAFKEAQPSTEPIRVKIEDDKKL